MAWTENINKKNLLCTLVSVRKERFLVVLLQWGCHTNSPSFCCNVCSQNILNPTCLLLLFFIHQLASLYKYTHLLQSLAHFLYQRLKLDLKNNQLQFTRSKPSFCCAVVNFKNVLRSRYCCSSLFVIALAKKHLPSKKKVKKSFFHHQSSKILNFEPGRKGKGICLAEWLCQTRDSI